MKTATTFVHARARMLLLLVEATLDSETAHDPRVAGTDVQAFTGTTEWRVPE